MKHFTLAAAVLITGMALAPAQAQSQVSAEDPGQTIATANLAANQVTLELTSSTTATGYFTLLAGSVNCGTAAQTASGEDSTGAPAFRFGSLSLTANVAGNYTVRNLTQNTAYTVCFTPDGTTAPVSTTVTTTAENILSSAAWSTIGSAGLSGGGIGNETDYESLAFAPDGTPYLAYMDNSAKATVMEYNGTSWVTVGAAGFSAGGTGYESLAFAPDGAPYVAYEDGANGEKATVMKYNGTAWVLVGSAGFSAGIVEYVSLAFAPDGTPYVAYLDDGNSDKATVMEYNGTAWVLVGSAGFSAGEADRESLAFAPDGTPFVAYLDFSNNDAATVMKFDGTAWAVVGSADFSAGRADFESLAFAPDGTPYVAYQDYVNSGKATVMKYNGTAWVLVGSAGFSANWAPKESLAFAPDGTPYLAYSDVANYYYATVMKYDGTAWVVVGSAGFSAGEVDYVSLAFAPDGTPYVAYQDGANNLQATVMALFTPPTATTGTATPVTTTSATLNGTINDNGSATTVTFEWGTSPTYGNSVAATTPSGGVVTPGSGNTPVSVNLTNLSHNTPYYFRVDATANGVTVNGSGGTFTTSGGPLTITASSGSMTYGGTPPAITPVYTYDTFTNTTTAPPGLSTAPTCSTTATSSSPVGSGYTSSCMGAVDANYTISYVNGSVTVNPANNNTAITGHTPNPSVTGQAVTVSFSVTPVAPATTAPSGNVTVSDGLGDTCVAAVAAGKCNLTIRQAGTITLTASYAGGGNYNESTSPGVKQTVYKAVTGISITSHSPNPSVMGQPVTVGFTVSAAKPGSGTPTGTVSVSDLVGDSCSAPVGAGSCQLAFTQPGPHVLLATYTGDSNYLGSITAKIPVNVEDFAIVASSGAQQVLPGGRTSYAIGVIPVDGLSDAVSLACTGAPTNTTCAISPNSVTLSGPGTKSSTATITTTSKAAPGTYTLTLTGKYGSGSPATGGLTHSAQVKLTIM